MAFTGPIQLSNQDVYRTSTNKLMTLGTQGATRDGRLFRYGLAGAVTLAPGKINQIPAVVANHQNVTVQTAASVYDQTLAVTLGATATTAGQYDDGYVVGYDVSGFGQTLRIAGTPVVASSGVAVFNLGDPVAQAMTTSAKVNLEQNMWSAALVYATGATTLLCNGVANVSIPATTYGWFQTRGTAAVLGNGTIAAGSGVIPGQTTAGSVDIELAATVTQRVGFQQQAGASTKYNTVYLTID
jgi:hypothetical protein